MKCGQTGRLHTVKLTDLTTEEGSLGEGHLSEGTDLILSHKGKDYSVKFCHLKGKFAIITIASVVLQVSALSSIIVNHISIQLHVQLLFPINKLS